MYVDIDFGFGEEGVRSHAKKKNNKAATTKKPAISNALDDGDKKPDEVIPRQTEVQEVGTAVMVATIRRERRSPRRMRKRKSARRRKRKSV
jgi:hypothetical protein